MTTVMGAYAWRRGICLGLREPVGRFDSQSPDIVCVPLVARFLVHAVPRSVFDSAHNHARQWRLVPRLQSTKGMG